MSSEGKDADKRKLRMEWRCGNCGENINSDWFYDTIDELRAQVRDALAVVAQQKEELARLERIITAKAQP